MKLLLSVRCKPILHPKLFLFHLIELFQIDLRILLSILSEGAIMNTLKNLSPAPILVICYFHLESDLSSFLCQHLGY